LEDFKKRDFKNIITKEEQLDIGNGNKANKVFGSFDDNNIKIKKNPTTEIKQKIKKSKFDVLTNEKDFLVKNLKKAG
jgi:hypothetical protein